MGMLIQPNPVRPNKHGLSGSIPVQLASLTFLAFLNLSYNQLVGMIPKGSQIQTFSDTSFQGNKGLCGYPLNINCNNASPVPSLVSRSDRVPVEFPLSLEPEIFVSAAVGFVVGLGVFIGLLVCCKRWNEWYFKHVEQVLERIFHLEEKRRRRNRRRQAYRDPIRRL
ncbi:hypothetical protein ACSBR2_034602 [Camellia fascicularis]